MKPGLRGRLMAAVILAVGVALVLTAFAFNLLLGARLEADVNDQLHSRASATLDSLQVVDGRLSAQEAPDAGAVDQPIWIFAGRHLVEAPQAGSAKLDAAARGLAIGPGRRLNAGSSTRLLSLPVLDAGRRLGTVVSGVSLVAYQRSEHLALVGSVAMALVVLVAVAFAGRWLLSAGLRPVDRMSAEAASWSERDLDRRFRLGPPRDEFTRLGSTLDGLLDRLSGGMRREQRFSAELSHELRTPLARMRARAQLALSEGIPAEEARAALSATVAETDKLTKAIDALLAASRANTAATGVEIADARQVAEAVAEGCGAGQFSGKAIEVSVRDGAGLRIALDPDLAERILSPVVENACRHATSRVGIAIANAGSHVSYLVTDDGRGVAPEQRFRIFEPGVSGERGDRRAGGGAGLGLALARRLARAGGGEVDVVPSDAGGRFMIRLPRG